MLSKAYGNFDRVVGLGWLLADAVGLPVLEQSDAYAVGIKARREAGDIQAAEATTKKELSRAKSKLAATDPARLQLEGKFDADMAVLLSEPVDLPLPGALPSAPPAAPRAATVDRASVHVMPLRRSLLVST